MKTEENKELKEKILKEVGYYVPYICKSNEWSNKAHQDIISLGNLQLSKKPLKDNWGDDWNDNPSDCNSGSAYDNDLWLELETNKKVIYTKEDILKVIDLTFDEVTKQAEKRFIEIIEESEMHGQIILDVQILDDERIRKSINPTAEEEKELIKEEYETKILSARIEERNKVCQEIKQKLTNHIPKEKGK